MGTFGRVEVLLSRPFLLGAVCSGLVCPAGFDLVASWLVGHCSFPGFTEQESMMSRHCLFLMAPYNSGAVPALTQLFQLSASSVGPRCELRPQAKEKSCLLAFYTGCSLLWALCQLPWYLSPFNSVVIQSSKYLPRTHYIQWDGTKSVCPFLCLSFKKLGLKLELKDNC